MNPELDDLKKFGIIAEVFDGKVTLVCEKHSFYYHPKRQATPGCKQCHMVQHLGLLIAVPAERREEILEDLEYSVHHLVEAAEKGQIDRIALYKHPQVNIAKGE